MSTSYLSSQDVVWGLVLQLHSLLVSSCFGSRGWKLSRETPVSILYAGAAAEAGEVATMLTDTQMVQMMAKEGTGTGAGAEAGGAGAEAGVEGEVDQEGTMMVRVAMMVKMAGVVAGGQDGTGGAGVV